MKRHYIAAGLLSAIFTISAIFIGEALGHSGHAPIDEIHRYYQDGYEYWGVDYDQPYHHTGSYTLRQVFQAWPECLPNVDYEAANLGCQQSEEETPVEDLYMYSYEVHGYGLDCDPGTALAEARADVRGKCATPTLPNEDPWVVKVATPSSGACRSISDGWNVPKLYSYKVEWLCLQAGCQPAYGTVICQ